METFRLIFRKKKLAAAFCVVALALLGACKKTEYSEMPNALGIVEKGQPTDEYDLEDIRYAGDLIMLTLYGPQTYYEYHGRQSGLQFEMAEKFAQSLGVKLRVEVAKDTAELLTKLQDLEADIIAVELPLSEEQKSDFIKCGAYSMVDSFVSNRRAWLVRKNSPHLAAAADKWYTPQIKEYLALVDARRFAPKRQRANAPMLNKQKGVISNFDNLFIRHSRSLGWDWRLLAAQAYQESAFDHKAVSWAGAQGLMQIMPATAAQLGLPSSQIFEPAANVQAAVKYINMLSGRFSDISNRDERINFVLAAYNGGYGHIRDAMALAKEHGKNPKEWRQVEEFVLKLREAKYYTHPVVQYGYMRGDETTQYVRAIRSRWEQYKKSLRAR